MIILITILLTGDLKINKKNLDKYKTKVDKVILKNDNEIWYAINKGLNIVSDNIIDFLFKRS